MLPVCNVWNPTVNNCEDFLISFRLLDDVTKEPISITGWFIEYTAKKNIGAVDASDLSAKSTDPDTGDSYIKIIESGGSDIGRFDMVIKKSLTTLLDSDVTYVHDMAYTTNNNETLYFFKGNLNVEDTATCLS